ncbi:unnamed protein product, partial [Brenthis ino]
MRHARKWSELVDKGRYPDWMKKRDEIITDIETKDWIFREAEIDELQSIRQALLHKLQAEQTQKTTTRTTTKLANLWINKKSDMEARIETIRRTRDRELRKLSSNRSLGACAERARASRAARGGGPASRAARDPAADARAPRARHGYQASRRHAEIVYDASLIVLEDHAHLAEPPAWLEQCGQNLKKSCSGGHIPRDKTQLCERETKWSEQFLENLHNDLKKARLGAASTSAGPLRVLKPRRIQATPRPSTPEVESVPDDEEITHQSALMMQKVFKGRAVQNLMYEGRTRAAELTEELKTTHGLQKEDRARIAKEESKARDYNEVRSEMEQKEAAISSLVEELCGGAVSSALDFLEKELRRLKEERRQHAFILIAIREKTMREAAEAGRRQKEEHRRREHDEMFKHVLGVTQETVDAYLQDVAREASALAAERAAVREARAGAGALGRGAEAAGSTAEQNEVVAELVQQFLLPAAHKEASRSKVSALQAAGLRAARSAIFGIVDDGVGKVEKCIRCGNLLDVDCNCQTCPVRVKPVETTSRDDPRWKHARTVEISRYLRKEEEAITRDISHALRHRTEMEIEVREAIGELISRATGEVTAVKRPDYRHYMRRIYEDALERSEHYQPDTSCPKLLPSELRRIREDEEAKKDPYCHCEETKNKIKFGPDMPQDKSNLLPSELRILEDFRRCKCDTTPSPSPVNIESSSTEEYTASEDSNIFKEEYEQ